MNAKGLKDASNALAGWLVSQELTTQEAIAVLGYTASGLLSVMSWRNEPEKAKVVEGFIDAFRRTVNKVGAP